MLLMKVADMNRHSKTPVALAASALVVASLFGAPAVAQSTAQDKLQPVQRKTAPGKTTQAPATTAPKNAAAPVPPLGEIKSLIQTTLRKLNRDNKLNNYEELHESMTPEMQLSVTPQKLSDAFSGFRRDGIDLSGVARIEPQFLRQPSVDDNGVLTLNGMFPSQPSQPRVVLFNLGYRKIDGIWMLQAFQINAPTQDEFRMAQAQERQRQAMANDNKTAGAGPALDYTTSPPTAMRW